MVASLIQSVLSLSSPIEVDGGLQRDYNVLQPHNSPPRISAGVDTGCGKRRAHWRLCKLQNDVDEQYGVQNLIVFTVLPAFISRLSFFNNNDNKTL